MRTLSIAVALAVLGAGFSFLRASEGFDELSNRAKVGASEEALAAFVEKSTVAYDLTVDEIFFLSDLGYSSHAIATIVEHGKSIRSGKKPVMTEIAIPVTPLVPEDVKGAAKQPDTVSPVADDSAKATDPVAAKDGVDAVAKSTEQQPVVLEVVNADAAQATPAETIPASLVTSTGETLTVQESVSATPGAAIPVASAPEGEVSVEVFYETLQPYGTWIKANNEWCWRPTACVTDPNWRPYCDRGHWVWTDSDWCWQSDYSWGWAPFHYGRWTFCEGFGWIWQPDTCWSPAWVSWRECDSHFGWAPLPWGCRYDVGLGFWFHGRHWGVDCGFGLGFGSFIFCERDHFCDHSLRGHVLHRHDNAALFNRSQLVNNTVIGANNRVVVNGPKFDHVQKFSATPIKQLHIDDAHVKVGDSLAHAGREDHKNGTIQMFRPTLKATTTHTPETFAAVNKGVLGSTVKASSGVKLAPITVHSEVHSDAKIKTIGDNKAVTREATAKNVQLGQLNNQNSLTVTKQVLETPKLTVQSNNLPVTKQVLETTKQTYSQSINQNNSPVTKQIFETPKPTVTQSYSQSNSTPTQHYEAPSRQNYSQSSSGSNFSNSRSDNNSNNNSSNDSGRRGR